MSRKDVAMVPDIILSKHKGNRRTSTFIRETTGPNLKGKKVFVEVVKISQAPKLTPGGMVLKLWSLQGEHTCQHLVQTCQGG